MSVADVSPGRRGIAWQVTVPSSAAFVGNIVAVEKKIKDNFLSYPLKMF